MGARFVDDIPEAPVNLVLNPDPTQQLMILEWTNPLYTVHGNPLDTLESICIWRNGEPVAIVSGEIHTYTDPLPRPDFYRYQICVIDTGGGEGRRLYTAESWLGGPISGILIWDLDPTPLTGNALVTELHAVGYSRPVYISHLSHRYPVESGLEAVFVCLGVFANNHILTDEEGEILRQYLIAGGNIYMEGGDTWYYDPPTPVHALFQINAVGDGSNDLNGVVGQAGTPFAQYQFGYNGENNFIDEIEQTVFSQKILFNPVDTRGTAVMCNGDGYQTIGASFEFGGLVDGTPPSTKRQLLQSYLEFFGMISGGVGGGGEEGDIPQSFALLQNYPNPFNPTTVISWQLPASSTVRLAIYDLTGREVAVLVNQPQPAGLHSMEFDSSDLASGIYVYRLKAGAFVASRKMIVLK